MTKENEVTKVSLEDLILNELPAELKTLPDKIPYPQFMINDALATMLKDKKIFIDHETLWIKAL